MAASAGTVTLNLDANSVKLLRELQKTERRTKQSANTMAADFGRAFTRIAKSAAVGAAAVAGAMTVIYRAQSKVIDELGKTADALGVQTERLQALQHVASLTGTSADALSTNLERMQRRLGEVARRGGPSEKALTDIGISIQDIINLPADKQLEEISKAMASVENAAVRASIANDLFGRDGVRMLKMMEQLKNDGLDPVVEQMDNLGMSISRIDSARLERANDAMFTLRQTMTGVFQRIAINMSDFVYSFAQAFTDMAENSDMLGDHIDEMFHRVIRGSINVYESIMNSVQPIFDIVKAMWDGFRSLPAWVQEVGIVGAILGGAKGRLALLGLAASMAAIERTMGVPSFMKGDEDSFSLIGAAGGFISPDSQNNVDAQVSKLRQAYDRVIADREEFRRTYQAASTGMAIFIDPEDAESEVGQMSEFAKQAARNVQSAFADFLFDPFKDGLKGMLRGFVDTIRRMVAEVMASQILSAMFGGLSKSANPIIAAFGSALKIEDRDSGGRGAAGQPYMIGRGAQPEIFIPDSAGTFIPNADKMGGQSLTINVDARDEGAEARIRDMINREMAPQIIAAAKGSTVAALRRPRFA